MEDSSELTRKIYHRQHERVINDERAMERFLNMLSYQYFGLPENYFKDKKILDAGCGGTGKMIISLYRLGANNIFAFDLGEEFIPNVYKSLKKHNVPIESVTLKSGNIIDIPFDNKEFDFVCCHGVLIHLNNFREVKTAFSELSRITKPGGFLYTVYGLVGGLWEEAIVPSVRKYYNKDKSFREVINNIKPDDFDNVIDYTTSAIEKYEGEKVDLSFLKGLLDEDLCVTIQNALQAPVRLAINEEMIRKMYEENNFYNLKRLRRYIIRKNIRRYFAPLHYENDYPISKLLYGSGNLEFIGEKRLSK